jgi:subtilase family serine protease
MNHLRRVLLPLAVALLVSSLPSFSQTLGFQTPASQTSQTPEPRIKGPITEASRAVLSNSRTPRVRAAEDLGALSSETPIPGITLVFKRSPTQEAILQELLSAQQNQASPLYHQWLTPETFATRFGVADQDLAATQSWLTSRGFHIDSVSRSRDRITFSGTAAQVQAAFGTELHHYRTADNETHFAPAADLSLPAELAPLTAAVLHLSDFRPRPNLKVQTRPHPDYTDFTTGTHYLIPYDIAAMYDLAPFYQTSDGSGQGLAIVGQSYVDTSGSSKIATFQSDTSGQNPVTPVFVPGSGVQATSPGDQGESEIDLEYSSGIAYKSNIFFVYVGANQNYDVFDALAFAIDQKIAPVVSISYGICEPLMSATDLDQGNSLFEQASAQGQTLVAASGDSGSTTCAQFTFAGLTLTQEQALSVSYPADSPYVTAVGGTQMAPGTFAAGPSPYWATASSNTPGLLLSYVPEIVWNEGSTSFGIAASGGGTSAHFTRPTWQSGVPGITPGAFRLLPDVALQSSIESPGFLLCSSDPTIAGTNSCTTGLQSGNGLSSPADQFTIAGGTSFATPIFAGFIAILNEIEHANGQGNINPELYTLASNSTKYAAVFHDIVSGSNACISGTGNCAASGQAGYAATPGFDEATGLGSIDFGQLAKAWPSTSNANLASTKIIIQTVSAVAAGTSEPIQIFVSPINFVIGASVPTGSVVVAVDGTVVGSPLALLLAQGTTPQANASFNFVAPSTPGSHLLTVSYSGDATYSSSVATYSILVGNVTATGSFTVTAPNLTIANGGTGSTQITTTPNGGYTGRVVWSLSASTTSTTATQTICYSIGQPTTSNINAVSLTIGVGTACNAVAPAERSNLRFINPRITSKQEPPSSSRKTSQIALYAGLILCGSIAARRRKIRLTLLLVLASLACVTTVLTGCGSSSGGGSSSTPPPTTTSSATTYTLTLTGTDSVNTAITASTTFTLTVK